MNWYARLLPENMSAIILQNIASKSKRVNMVLEYELIHIDLNIFSLMFISHFSLININGDDQQP